MSRCRSVTSSIRRLTVLGDEELMSEAKNLGAPFELVRRVAKEGKLPVPNFAAGGVATHAMVPPTPGPLFVANVFEGSYAALAYVGCVGCVVANNTIIDPENWILRIP